MSETEEGATGAPATVADTAAAEAQLFDALCGLEGDALKARLGEIGRENPDLGARLRRLLAIDAEYAEHTARMVASDDIPDPTGRIGEGDEIGAFRLLRKIGRGGMGVVYLAERRNDFAQRVAIKIMPRFAIDARSSERFAQERQLLAQLRHPNICSIVDGGELRDGTPWLAMEYVPGENLVGWCARNTAPLRERIELFLQLCDAVQYAHQRLVIHRDIKDSNVLIETIGGGRATVKLLDFGIAKSLEDEGGDDRTAAQDRFFSPMTAAPEQIRGDRATVAVDVYALGALLHQLLCGVLPFAQPRRDPAQLQRAILETVPPKMSEVLMRTAQASRRTGDARTGAKADAGTAPATLPQGARSSGAASSGARASDTHASATIAPDALRGELDAIVAHCLRKAPDERYPDVGALARDLRAWLSGHPVSVSGDDRLYRLGKFLRRNRLPVALAGATALSVIAALIVSLWQAQQLREQRDAAQAARARSEIDLGRARAVADFMRESFEQADPGKASEGGLLARELIDRGRRKLPALDGQRETQAELALMLAESFSSMGLVRDSRDVLVAYRPAIETLSSKDADLRWRVLSLDLTNRLQLDDVGTDIDRAIEAAAVFARTPKQQVELARLRERLLVRRSEFDDAAKVLETAWNEHARSLDPDSRLRLRVDLGNALLSNRRNDDAHRLCAAIAAEDLAPYEPALQIRAYQLLTRELDARDAGPAAKLGIVKRWQAAAETLYGSESIEAANAYLWRVGVIDDPREQEALIDKAYAIQQAKLPPVSAERAKAEYNVAYFFLYLREQPARAEPHLAQAVAIGRKVYSRAHPDVRTFELDWARALNRLGLHARCLEALSSPPGDDNPKRAERLSRLHLELAKAARALGRTAQAAGETDAAKAVWRALATPIPADIAKEIAGFEPALGRRPDRR